MSLFCTDCQEADTPDPNCQACKDIAPPPVYQQMEMFEQPSTEATPSENNTDFELISRDF